MSQETVENQLIDRTIAQRNKIIEDAKAKAAKIAKNAKAEKKRIEAMTDEAIVNVIGGELRAVHDRVVGSAQLQGRRIVMEARIEVIEKVFKKAADAVKAAVVGTEYNGYLIKMAAESISTLNEDCIVYANAKDAKYLKSNMEQLAVGVKIKIETSPEDIVGGVKIVNLEGTKTITSTLDARLNAANEGLTSEVAEKLGVI
ncbi:hypothetical protein HN807_00130 [Candidatus Bathyarchaeota archaeon]|jgi:vacuolar-type H+-ATPase subunit E/Vma4|nr:hypothetical protein [Candidatus Bathyarchaeota archaeon]MBT4319270.1 hypothetical protein [Candidatus Bathyarchaeota archaeon]MBT4422882.1 hypothetical protein [Candidatus Bathyarchaeota archaeon]MBT5642423.1 hypothetical protein [Candidatus Bathyarchaeota archaeon]MBT6603500.1 hypothetical protein [Candidatus Bathyarchaeota archaeon]